jgi:recombination protein RecT
MANENTAIAPLKAFNQFIANPRTQEYLTTVLAEKKASFVNNITALVSNNAALQVCKPDTLMFASLKATALDLPLDQNLGFAYVLPYKDNKSGTTLAQFQMGYKGFIQLAIRSGQFKTINARDVREGELVGEDFITGELTFKKAENRESLPVVGYVAYFKLLNGFEKYLYMTAAEVKAHALRFSQTFKRGYGLWADKEMFDSMAKKTVIKLLLSKYAPLSVEMQKIQEAVDADQSVMRNPGQYEYVDNTPDEQPQPESATAKEKAEAVKAQVEAAKARRNNASAPKPEPKPEPTPAPETVNTDTGEVREEEDDDDALFPEG